jgi:hypothetical protein
VVGLVGNYVAGVREADESGGAASLATTTQTAKYNRYVMYESVCVRCWFLDWLEQLFFFSPLSSAACRCDVFEDRRCIHVRAPFLCVPFPPKRSQKSKSGLELMYSGYPPRRTHLPLSPSLSSPQLSSFFAVLVSLLCFLSFHSFFSFSRESERERQWGRHTNTHALLHSGRDLPTYSPLFSLSALFLWWLSRAYRNRQNKNTRIGNKIKTRKETGNSRCMRCA